MLRDGVMLLQRRFVPDDEGFERQIGQERMLLLWRLMRHERHEEQERPITRCCSFLQGAVLSQAAPSTRPELKAREFKEKHHESHGRDA